MSGGPGYKRWPDHKVDLIKSDKHVLVIFNGEVVADSERTIIVDESGHSIVYYFPRSDVRMDYMQRTNHHTYCPFKGEASYYTLTVRDKKEENAVWTYEEPYDEVRELKDYIAFYADRVDKIEIMGNND
jgi:uncharacterized protein (DUF427 family)